MAIASSNTFKSSSSIEGDLERFLSSLIDAAPSPEVVEMTAPQLTISLPTKVIAIEASSDEVFKTEETQVDPKVEALMAELLREDDEVEETDFFGIEADEEPADFFGLNNEEDELASFLADMKADVPVSPGSTDHLEFGTGVTLEDVEKVISSSIAISSSNDATDYIRNTWSGIQSNTAVSESLESLLDLFSQQLKEFKETSEIEASSVDPALSSLSFEADDAQDAKMDAFLAADDGRNAAEIAFMDSPVTAEETPKSTRRGLFGRNK